MFPVVVPPPTVLYDVDVIWPFTGARRIAAGDAWETTGLRGGAVEVPVLPLPVAGALMAVDARGQVYGRLESSGGGAKSQTDVEYARAYVPLVATGLPAAYANPSWYRVYRVSLGLRAAAIVPAVWSYAGWSPEGWAGAGSPETNNPFFGIRGDGAGSWVYVARNAAGAAVQESVALGILQTAFVIWDFVIFSAGAGGPALFSLYANGALLLARAWGTGSRLPLATDGVAGGSHYTFTLGAADGAVACALQLSSLRCRVGRFNVNGYGV